LRAGKTEIVLCEAGLPTLAEIRELNTTIVATQVLMNEMYPIRHIFTNRRIQDEYAMRNKKGTPSLIFINTIDKFGELRVGDKKRGDSAQLQLGSMDDGRVQVARLHHV
jgi:hypothetical protein